MKTVLTVDDSSSIRQLIAAALSANGFGVEMAEDGELGLSAALGGSFDLIISDVNMPNMNGYEFVRELRQTSEYEYTPVLMLTTEFEDAKKQEGRHAGANGWIIKPIDIDQLLRAVNRVLPD